MFNPHYSTCIKCKKDDTLIVVKAGYCMKCNHNLKQEKKKASGKSIDKKQTFKATGEKDIFHYILDSFEDEPINCFVCRKRLSLITHSNFAHILRKGRYERFRLNPDNIKIMCYSIDGDNCHYKFDNTPRSNLTDPMWSEVFELEERLKKEYNLKYN
jgi:hypothetical protein